MQKTNSNTLSADCREFLALYFDWDAFTVPWILKECQENTTTVNRSVDNDVQLCILGDIDIWVQDHLNVSL